MTREEFYDKLEWLNSTNRIPEEVWQFAAKSYGENEKTLDHLAYYYFGQNFSALVDESENIHAVVQALRDFLKTCV